MSEPVSNAEIEDVLASIRRLVSENAKALRRDRERKSEDDKLVLTPAHRIDESTSEPQEADVFAVDTETWNEAARKPAETSGADIFAFDSQRLRNTPRVPGERRPAVQVPDAELVEDASTAPAAEPERAEEATQPDPVPQAHEAAHAGTDEAAGDAPPAAVAAKARPQSDLERQIAELEAAVGRRSGEFEPDGSETASTSAAAPDLPDVANDSVTWALDDDDEDLAGAGPSDVAEADAEAMAPEAETESEDQAAAPPDLDDDEPTADAIHESGESIDAEAADAGFAGDEDTDTAPEWEATEPPAETAAPQSAPAGEDLAAVTAPVAEEPAEAEAFSSEPVASDEHDMAADEPETGFEAEPEETASEPAPLRATFRTPEAVVEKSFVSATIAFVSETLAKAWAAPAEPAGSDETVDPEAIRAALSTDLDVEPEPAELEPLVGDEGPEAMFDTAADAVDAEYAGLTDEADEQWRELAALDGVGEAEVEAASGGEAPDAVEAVVEAEIEPEPVAFASAVDTPGTDVAAEWEDVEPAEAFAEPTTVEDAEIVEVAAWGATEVETPELTAAGPVEDLDGVDAAAEPGAADDDKPVAPLPDPVDEVEDFDAAAWRDDPEWAAPEAVAEEETPAAAAEPEDADADTPTAFAEQPEDNPEPEPDTDAEWEDLDMADAGFAMAGAVGNGDAGGYGADEIEAEADEPDAAARDDEAIIDEEMLRELVARMVREELQGTVGERITHNVRRLIRREIARALSLQEFD